MINSLDYLRWQNQLLQQQQLGNGQQAQQPQQNPLPKLSPQEESDLLSQLGAVGGSALNFIGNTLDYLGRPVRGLLGGHPEELAALIPFSDSLGITDKQNEVSGRGMLENWGVLDKQPEGAGFFDDPVGNTAGIAASILTDPLTWMGFGLAKHGAGALSQGGKVARTLGILPDWKTGLQVSGGLNTVDEAEKFIKPTQIGRLQPGPRMFSPNAPGALGHNATAMSTTLDEMLAAKGVTREAAEAAAKAQGYNLDDILNQKLSGLVGVGPPVWGADNWATLGHGPLAQGIANTLENAKLAARFSAPGRFMAGLFDVPSKQMSTAGGQIGARETTEATEAGQAGAAIRAAKRSKAWEDLGLTPREGTTAERAQRNVYENTRPLTTEEAAIRDKIKAGETEGLLDPTLTANRDPRETARYWFPSATDEQLDKMLGIRTGHAADREAEITAKAAAGQDTALKDETIDYAGRQATPPPGVRPTKGVPAEALQTTGIPGRADEYGNFPPTKQYPGGTESVNLLGEDHRINGPTANMEGVPLERTASAPNGDLIDKTRLSALPPSVQAKALAAFNKDGMLGLNGAIGAARLAGEIPENLFKAAEASGAFKALTHTTPEAAKNIIFDYKGFSKPEVDQGLVALKKYGGLPDKAVRADLAKNFGGDADLADNALEKMKAFKAENEKVELLMKRGQQGKLPSFPNDPETDSLKLAMHNIENRHAAEAVARNIGRTAMPAIGAGPSIATGVPGDAGVEILQNLKDSKLSGPGPLRTIAEELHGRGLLSDQDLDVLRKGPMEVPPLPIAKSGKVLGPAEELTAATAGQTGKEVQAALDAHEAAKAHNAAYEAASNAIHNYRIPVATANENNRLLDFLSKGPESLKAGGGWYKNVTQLFKAWNVAPWPANKIRDLMSGLWQQLVGGWHYGSEATSHLNPANWGRPIAHGFAILRGETPDLAKFIPDLKGLSPEAATEAVKREMFATKLMGGAETAALNPADAGTEAFRSIKSQLPGTEPFKGIGPTLSSMLPRSWEQANPLNIRGVGGRTEDVNSLIKGGREFSDYVWSGPKLGIYLAARSKGIPMEQATAIAKAAMVDFEKLTPFERKIMRPMAPFMTWTRHMVPWIVSELAHNPGGVTGQAIRLAGGAGKPREFTPKQLEGGTAIPLSGEDETGNKKWLAGFDLPFETIGELFHPGRTSQESVGNTLAGWAGFLNPVASIPIELATNRQLYTGRELSDLKGRVGLIGQQLSGSERPWPVPPLLEQILSNGPTARLVSSTGKLLDPRKSALEKFINLGTGIHTADIDMPNAREIAARDAASLLLQGTPGVHRYTDVYVKKEDIPQLSPGEAKLYAIYRDISAKRQAEARAKKKMEAGATP